MRAASYLGSILQLCKHYGWEHDFWRRMGVREFDAVCKVTGEQQSQRSSPDSWDGYESDPFWQQAHARR